jgi:hypothetical protein
MPDAHFAANRAYVQGLAFTALIKTLRNVPLSDDELTAFVLALDDDQICKETINRLISSELITVDQAALAYYARPQMRGA